MSTSTVPSEGSSTPSEDTPLISATNCEKEDAFDCNEQSNLDDIAGVVEPLKCTKSLRSPSVRRGTMVRRESTSSMHSLLYTVPHLFTLTEEQVTSLDIMFREYSELDIIIEEGTQLSHVYVLVSGTVEVINAKVGRTSIVGHRRVGSITAPNIFGIDNVILESFTEFSYHASSAAILLLIPKHQFCDLFARSPMFASSVSVPIAQSLPSFTAFGDFSRCLFGLSSSSVSGKRNFGEGGYKLSIPTAVRIYESSGTVFHKLMHSSSIDTDALNYCLKRLPEDITETYVITLSRSMPSHLSNDMCFSRMISPEPTGGRKGVWKVGKQGQIIVMARDGFTDIIDFVTNLCMLIVESKKIRLRLQRLASPLAMHYLRNSFLVGNTAQSTAVKGVLSQLPFSEAEIEGLMQVSDGARVMKLLYNILLQRGDFIVYVDVNMSKKFSEDPYLKWSLCICRHIRAELGIKSDDIFPSNLTIDILFSSNISIKNLLCSTTEGLRQLFEEHVEFQANNNNNKKNSNSNTLKDSNDYYIYVLTELLQRESTLREVYRQRLEESGFIMMEDTSMTGLVVDLVNINKLRVSDVDSVLRHAVTKRQARGGNGFIINIDRTFGGQIEAILRAIFLLLGNHIESVNLTGSVAGLVGNRGDIVLPNKLLFSKHVFGEDSTDEVRLCNTDAICEKDVLPFLGEGRVTLHRGSCAMIPGIVVYSDSVLRFYKVVHECTAVDMRSSYVARQLEESHRTGVLRNNVKRRFLFYMDTVPLKNEDVKGTELEKNDILYSIYVTSRSLLHLIFSL